MTGSREKTNLMHLVRFLFPLILTAFLIVQSQLSKASSLGQFTQEPPPPPPPQYTEGPTSHSSLCGKLVFIKDFKTSATLLGLRTCSGSEVLIFEQRPAELFNYYEFYGIVIDKGPRLSTDKGELNQYITSFVNYRQISDCSKCGQPDSIPTPTFPPEVTTPEVTAPVVSTEVLGVVTEVASVPPQSSAVTQECIVKTAEIIGQAFGFPKHQFLIDQAPDMLKEAPLDVCGGDPSCELIVNLKTLVGGMVQAGFEASPGPRPAGQVIGAFARFFDDPSMKTACTSPGAMAWEGAKQFSMKGVAIDAYAIHSPADLHVRDFDFKESGFYPNGQVKQDIPQSLTRKDGDSEYVFLPGGKAKDVEFEGTGDGAMTFEAIRGAGTVVQEIGYDQVPVDAQTKGLLNTSNTAAGARPKLEITASSSGQLASLDPTRYEEFAIQASVAPVTATPTITATPTLTPTPAGFQLPGDSQLWIGLILVACVVAFLALLGIGLIYTFFIRKRSN